MCRSIGQTVTAAAPVLAAALFGRRSTIAGLAAWYEFLAKPKFNPPPRVFGPIWTALYGLMIVAQWRILRLPRDTPGRPAALNLFYAQLALNAAWPAMFFGWRSPRAGLANIALQWLAILAAIDRFGRLDRGAAACLAPLSGWVGFAALLNFEIWRRNRS